MNKKVLLFAPQGFEDIEVAAFTDILGWTKILKDVRPVDLTITGFKKNVYSKHGLSVKTHILLKDINPKDYKALIIPGGFNDRGYTEVYHKKVIALIQDIHNNGGIVATMCVGSLPVARSGILKGRKATTYLSSRRHDNLQILRDCGAIAVKNRIVVSDRIITNRGPGTAMEVAFKLLEMLNGKGDVREIKRTLMFK
jgi:4-methyl-5(b-hydroxyethyl)-thiazole monophosphate biosynthesis